MRRFTTSILILSAIAALVSVIILRGGLHLAEDKVLKALPKTMGQTDNAMFYSSNDTAEVLSGSSLTHLNQQNSTDTFPEVAIVQSNLSHPIDQYSSTNFRPEFKLNMIQSNFTTNAREQNSTSKVPSLNDIHPKQPLSSAAAVVTAKVPPKKRMENYEGYFAHRFQQNNDTCVNYLMSCGL
jgi:hypothetical protein